MNSSTISHTDIAQRAHEIWEQSGRPEGQETEHWLRAERELRQERGLTRDDSRQENAGNVGGGKNNGERNRRARNQGQSSK
jgi:hypothetical protein